MTSHTLYRFFASDGALLYVGRTVNPGRRWREHEKTKPWFDDVASVTREVFATAEAVDLAEREAIALEQPRHNIALAGRRPAGPRPAAVRKPPAPVIDADTFLRRLKSLPEGVDLPAEGECLGDETVCECAHCHAGRELQFEDMRSKYDWHPQIKDEISAVEKLYYQGAYLMDWYYDFFDIEMFARVRLVEESKLHPFPAYVEFEGTTACVECPFCWATHRHFLASGAALDTALEAPCARVKGGRYRLVDDWCTHRDQMILWGEKSAQGYAA